MVKEYQERPDEVASRAWNRGYLTALELFRVAAWETGQGLGALTINTGTTVRVRDLTSR
jgi:hypothetical protein